MGEAHQLEEVVAQISSVGWNRFATPEGAGASPYYFHEPPAAWQRCEPFLLAWPLVAEVPDAQLKAH